MSDNEEVQIARLAERQAGFDARLNHIEGQIASQLRDLCADVSEIKIGMARRKECPDPGLCMQLSVRLRETVQAFQEQVSRGERRLDSHSARLQAIETLESERKGGWKTIVVVSGLVSGLVGIVMALFSAVAKHFVKP